MSCATQITVEFECACGRRVRKVRTAAGRRTVKCDECRREANKAAAQRSYAGTAPDQRHRQRTDWRERNRDSARRAAKAWAQRNRAKVSANTLNYRARKRGVFRHHVDRDVLYELDNGRCGICGHRVPPNSGWHVDHIVPLSKGGEHSYLNCQVSHALCNRRKNARLP